MSIRIKLAITLVTFLAAMAFTTTVSAQTGAGAACTATQCGLGGQIRGQIGDGLPLPISIAPGYAGAFLQGTTVGGHNNAVMKTVGVFPGAPLVGHGLGQPGQVKPSAMAFVKQTAGASPKALTFPSNQFGYGPAPQGSIGVVNFNLAVFAVQTNLIFDSPHPGTTEFGNVVVVPGGGGSRMQSKGLKGGGTIAAGRPGLTTISFYAGASSVGVLATNFGRPGSPTTLTAMAGDLPPKVLNGLARFVATGNQFGGISTGRTLGTARVYFNGGSLDPTNDLPCTGTVMCQFQLSSVLPGSTGVAGGPFGGTVNNAAFQTATGVFTGTIGFNGTIVGIGNAVTFAGSNIPFTGQGATSIGFPVTTGRLTISVTSLAPGAATEMFKRTGIDARDGAGNGVIATVTGSMSKRSISKGNANRTWSTAEIPEPSAIFAASAGLLALFGCHQMVRRRSR